MRNKVIFVNLNHYLLGLILLSFIAVSGCSVLDSNGGDSAVGSRPSKEEEHNTAVWLLSKFGSYEDPLADQLMNSLLARLGSGLKAINLTLPNDTRVNVYILQSLQKGAFSQCNGSIYITRGLLTSLANLSELSSILAHELAHIVNEDACFRLRPVKSKSGEGADSLSFDLESEKKADKLAGKILVGSFIDPQAMLGALSVQFDVAYMSKEEGIDLRSRLSSINESIKNTPQINTKFAEDRLYRKLKAQMQADF